MRSRRPNLHQLVQNYNLLRELLLKILVTPTKTDKHQKIGVRYIKTPPPLQLSINPQGAQWFPDKCHLCLLQQPSLITKTISQPPCQPEYWGPHKENLLRVIQRVINQSMRDRNRGKNEGLAFLQNPALWAPHCPLLRWPIQSLYCV